MNQDTINIQDAYKQCIMENINWHDESESIDDAALMHAAFERFCELHNEVWYANQIVLDEIDDGEGISLDNEEALEQVRSNAIEYIESPVMQHALQQQWKHLPAGIARWMMHHAANAAAYNRPFQEHKYWAYHLPQVPALKKSS